MNMAFKTRDLVYIAILGAVWGVLELTLGSYLHVCPAWIGCHYQSSRPGNVR